MKLRISLGILFLISLHITSPNNVVYGSSDKTTVVFLGASNTVEEITSVPRNGSYITYLRSLNPTWEGVNLIDKAISGWGVGNYYGEVTLINETVFETNPDYVVIVLGGNDFLRSTSADRFEIRYLWLLDALILLDTQSEIKEIFLANIFWGTIELDETRTSVFEQFQEIIANASRDYEFPLLDFFNTTVNRPEYFVDNIHLNDLGHEAIAITVDEIIRPYLLGNISRTAEFSKITDVYTNTYTENGAGIVVTSAVFVLLVITKIRRFKGKEAN